MKPYTIPEMQNRKQNQNKNQNENPGVCAVSRITAGLNGVTGHE